jgi:hypothetical protein
MMDGGKKKIYLNVVNSLKVRMMMMNDYLVEKMMLMILKDEPN